MATEEEKKLIREALVNCFNNVAASAINTLTKEIHDDNVDAGWWPEGSKEDPLIIPSKLCLVHSEISEAMEGARKNLMDDKLTHRSMFSVELADAFIRICDLAGAYGIDLGTIVQEKRAFNAQRADHKPEARQAEHGKKF